MSRVKELKARLNAGQEAAVNVLGVPRMRRPANRAYRDPEEVRSWTQDMKAIFHTDHARIIR